MEFVRDISITPNDCNIKKLSSSYRDVLKIFFQNMKDAFISYKNNSDKINHKKMYIDDDNIELDEPNVFFPAPIHEHIMLYASTKYSYNFILDERIFVVEFVFFNQIPDKKVISSYIKKIYMWLYILSLYAKQECTKTLRITIFLSNFKKKMSWSQFNSQSDILDAINVNTAWTYRCKEHNSITIYRKEEWFKVLCHETIHTFGLDFDLMPGHIYMDKCNSMFNIQSDFLLNESYCEFLATIWSTIFNEYCMCSSPKLFNEFADKYYGLMFTEKQYSIFQAIKVLNYMKLNYYDLFNFDLPRQQFVENSNVFCYYVVKSLLLFNDTKTIALIVDMNENIMDFDDNNVNIMKFIHHIEDLKLDINFLDIINEIQEKKYNLGKRNKSCELLKSLKMTLHG